MRIDKGVALDALVLRVAGGTGLEASARLGAVVFDPGRLAEDPTPAFGVEPGAPWGVGTW